MGPIEVYAFENADGTEFGSYTTQDRREAQSYAQQHGLRVIAHTFEWSGSEPVSEWDYTDGAGRE